MAHLTNYKTSKDQAIKGDEADRSNKTIEVEETPFIDICKTPTNVDHRRNKEDQAQEPPTFYQNLSYYFSQFCGATSIHGLQYIGERGRFTLEKIVWTMLISVVCCLCIFLISKTYNKWATSPVIVTFATTETGIWEIPFPAVTICPEVKSDPEVFNFTQALLQRISGLSTKEEDQTFEAFVLVCADFVRDVFTDIVGYNNFTTYDEVLNAMLAAFISPNPYNITTIRWLGHELDWDDVITYTLTREGICYSFNRLSYKEIFRDADDVMVKGASLKSESKKWSLENGYPSDDEQDSYPRRTFLSGIAGGVTFSGLFTNHSYVDHACTEGLQGYKVALHHPSELPNMDKHFRVPLDQDVVVAIKPRMISVTDELKTYKPEDRKCYFADEKPLAFYKSYTQQNCLDECLANYTRSQCNCVGFYMPGAEGFRVCSTGKVECIENSKVKYLSGKNRSCNCLPLCTALEYDVEIAQSDWNWRELFKFMRHVGVEDQDLPFNDREAHLSKLVVFYKDLQFLASERHELYGYTDFFSNVGGLLGLFIGFSLTSLLEILYFLSLRLVCNIKKFGQHFWSGESALINDEKKQE